MERGNRILRFFDRWFGPVVLGLLAPVTLFRSTGSRKIETVALLKTAAIGDTVLLSSLVEDLRRHSVKVTLFTGSSNFEFAKRIEGLERVVRIPLTNPFVAVSLLRTQAFDVFIDADPWPRISALFTLLAKARIKVGFKTSGQYRHYCYDLAVEHSDSKHELENYRGLMRAVGLESTAAPQNFGHPWAMVQHENRILLHMWPGGINSHLKEWPAVKWRELAEKLLANFGSVSFGLTGGPDDRAKTKGFIEQLPESLRERFADFAGVSFTETLKVLQNSRLLVSVNTGIMHVGAAMGAPTVGLHGPTNPKRWGPIGPRTRSVLSRSRSAGTLNLGFEYVPDEDYMAGVEVEPVLRACIELLESESSQAPHRLT